MNKFHFLFIAKLSIQLCTIMNCNGGEVLLFCGSEVAEQVMKDFETGQAQTIIQEALANRDVTNENTPAETKISQEYLSLP